MAAKEKEELHLNFMTLSNSLAFPFLWPWKKGRKTHNEKSRNPEGHKYLKEQEKYRRRGKQREFIV